MATKVNYGMKTVEETFDSSTTIGDVITNRNILGYLGAPEDVVAIHQGQELALDALASGYAHFTLEKKGSEKG